MLELIAYIVAFALVLALVIAFFIWIKKDTFSEQEKSFVSFLRRKAKRSGVERKYLKNFLQYHLEEFKNEFMVMENNVVLLNDIPAIFSEVHRTYDKPERH